MFNLIVNIFTKNMKKLFVLLLPLLAAVGCLQEERSPEEILVPSPAQLVCGGDPCADACTDGLLRIFFSDDFPGAKGL